jgi:hypothetical protein
LDGVSAVGDKTMMHRTSTLASLFSGRGRRWRSPMSMVSPVFRQLFDPESSTYTYLLGCPVTKEALLIGEHLSALLSPGGTARFAGPHQTRTLFGQIPCWSKSTGTSRPSPRKGSL